METPLTDKSLAGALHIACLLAVAAVMPLYIWRFSLVDIPTNILEVLIGMAALTGVLSNRVRNGWKQALQTSSRRIILLIALFLIACVLSITISPHTTTSLGVFKGWIIVPLLYAGMVYVAAYQDRAIRRDILHIILWSGTAVALLSPSQLGSVDRVRGIYDTPNSLALFLAPLTVMALWKAIQTRKKVVLGQGIIMLVAIMASQTLMGGLTVGASLLIGMAFWHRPSRTEIWIIVCGILIGFLLFFPKIEYFLLPYTQSDTVSSASVRIQLWQISWQLIQEHPLLGIGLGTFEPAYQSKLHQIFTSFHAGTIHKEPIPEFVFRDPHNWILSFWLNTGLLGLISFIGIQILIFKSILKHPTKNISSQMITLGVISMLLFGLTDTIYWKNDLSILYWLIIVLLPW